MKFSHPVLAGGGPIHKALQHFLHVNYAPFSQFQQKQISMEDFVRAVETDRPSLESLGISLDDVSFAMRYPLNLDAFVETGLTKFRALSGLPVWNDPDQFRAYEQRVEAAFDPRGRVTYIAPEEARLLYCIAHMIAPKRVLVLGSYFGYWASFVMPALAATESFAELVDPDAEFNEIAAAALDKLGFGGSFAICGVDGNTHLGNTMTQYDLVVLDAELPAEWPDQKSVGKRIYSSLYRAVKPHIKPGGYLIAHNILQQGDRAGGTPFLACSLCKAQRELNDFYAQLEGLPSLILHSTEGLGIYKQ